jgi:ABC-type lipoprotein release transport system permease subunit
MLDTDGHPETLERIRNVVAPRLPGADVVTPATQAARWHAALADARRIVTLALVVTVAVAGASLTAATLGRLLERRRALTLLRAMGVPVKVIFISVLVEATVPLVLSVTVGAAFGMLTAAALVAALGGNSAQPLVAIGLLVVGSLLAGLSLVAATFPIIVRATSPHSLRTT